MHVLILVIIALLGVDDSNIELMPVEFNYDQLVKIAVKGKIAPPTFWGDPPYGIDPDGGIHMVPSTGGITYNFRTGDSAIDLAGDHVEPAVSLYNTGLSDSRRSGESRGLNYLACIGNKARVLTGDAKGAEGTVIGKHGGAEHVMIDFSDDSVFDKLAIGDTLQVYAFGLGMKFTNVANVKVFCVSPTLVEALTELGMGVTKEGKLRVPVARIVPAVVMGSGLGTVESYSGDYDIQLFDDETVREYGLDKLRFGDIVAITDAAHEFGKIYRKGAISIGVIAHSGSYLAGHGPGVTSLFTSKTGNIEPVMNDKANLAHLLKIRPLE